MLNEPPFAIVIGLAGLLGAALGSFLNVCILRWGAEPKLSVVSPRSRCPGCGHFIRWYENIPVISWLALRGRCSSCGERISALYPAVELATALLWAGSAALLGATLAALELAVAATLLLGIAVSDARAFIIPHEFSLGGTLIAMGFAAASTGFEGVLASVLGALFGAGLVLLVGEVTELILGQEAMGGGDCALMGMVGAFFGWEAVLPVVGLGAGISVVLYLAAALWLGRRGDRAAGEPGEPASFRWAALGRLLAGGLALLLLLGLALSAGRVGDLLLAFHDGVLGAGAAYYLTLVVPERAARGRWPRVRGLLGAAVGLAVGGGGAWQRIAAGAGLAGAALLGAGRGEPAAPPETTEELSAGGYLPFGVGLAVAAGVLAYAGGYERVRQVFAEFAPVLGLS